MSSQTSLFRYERGAVAPHLREEAGRDGDDDATYTGSRCAKCHKPLRGGGLYALGWGRLCWGCWHGPLGRRDGRTDLSSDAAGERNSGYNLRR